MDKFKFGYIKIDSSLKIYLYLSSPRRGDVKLDLSSCEDSVADITKGTVSITFLPKKNGLRKTFECTAIASFQEDRIAKVRTIRVQVGFPVQVIR